MIRSKQAVGTHTFVSTSTKEESWGTKEEMYFQRVAKMLCFDAEVANGQINWMPLPSRLYCQLRLIRIRNDKQKLLKNGL